MSVRRGCARLAISAAAVWFVFWTCAYVMRPYSTVMPQPATFAIRIGAWSVVVPCLIAIFGLGVWVAVGFRSTERMPLTRT